MRYLNYIVLVVVIPYKTELYSIYHMMMIMVVVISDIHSCIGYVHQYHHSCIYTVMSIDDEDNDGDLNYDNGDANYNDEDDDKD